jgi:hypothetical protein
MHSTSAALYPNVVEQRKDRGKEPALGDGKTGAQAQLLSSNCAKQRLRKRNESGRERGRRAVSGKEDTAVKPVAWF